jgi:hypothetical protein
MGEYDPLDQELRSLAEEAERHTSGPPDAATVRRLGTRRRRRRIVAIGVTAAVVIAIGGGAVFSATLRGSISRPPRPARRARA